MMTIRPLSPALTCTPPGFNCEQVSMVPTPIRRAGNVTEQVNVVGVSWSVSGLPDGVPVYRVAVTVVGLSKVSATVFIKVALIVWNVPDCGKVCTIGSS